MPIISMFYGIIIMMRFNEHLPPHFHAKYGEHEADFTLDGELIAGEMPRKQQRLIAAWTELHEEVLKADGDLCTADLTPQRIDGVRF